MGPGPAQGNYGPSQLFYPRTGQQLTYRKVLRDQVYLLARHIQGQESYEPFSLPV